MSYAVIDQKTNGQSVVVCSAPIELLAELVAGWRELFTGRAHSVAPVPTKTEQVLAMIEDHSRALERIAHLELEINSATRVYHQAAGRLTRAKILLAGLVSRDAEGRWTTVFPEDTVLPAESQHALHKLLA